MSSFNILLTSANYTPATGVMSYRLPAGTSFTGMECALSSMSMYNSHFNVSRAIGNNQITLRYPIYSAANTYVMTNYTCTLEDGFYTYDQLNEVLDNFCVQQGLYLMDQNSNPVTFQQFSINTVTYYSNIKTYYLPTSAQATTMGWTNPGGLALLNAGNQQVCPQLVITQAAMQYLTGFPPASYPAAPVVSTAATWSSTAASSSVASQTPQINKVTCVIVATNVVNNSISIPSNLLQLVPVTSSYGYVSQYAPGSLLYSTCMASTFQEIEVRFYDQNLEQLRPIDAEISVVLSFRSKPKM